MKTFLNLLAGCALLVVPGAAALAQTATLAADISRSAVDPPSPVSLLSALGEDVLFVQSTDQVRISDGNGGIRALAELCPGECSARAEVWGSVGGVQLWAVSDESRVQLWRSDGTRPGTFPLTGAEPGPARLSGYRALAGGLLYFSGCTGEPCRLWRTDGTREGTQPVKGFTPGGPYLDQIVAAGDRVFVAASSEVWVADRSGARRVRTFPYPAHLNLLASHGERLLFVNEYRQLWVSDGTTAGTRRLRNFNFVSEWLTDSSGGLYFVADGGTGEEIWKTDATEAGTRRITNLESERPFPSSLRDDRRQAVEIQGRLFFVAGDSNQFRFRLWRSDGSPGTTVPVSDSFIEPGLVKVGERVLHLRYRGSSCEIWSAGARGDSEFLMDKQVCGFHPVVAQDQAWFAEAHSTRIDAWRTDGTPQGTVELGTLSQSDTYEEVPVAVSASTRKVFVPSREEGLWVWTEETGLRQVTGAAPGNASSDPWDVLSFGGRTLFSACDGTSRDLWTSDGTPAGTAPLLHFDRDCAWEGFSLLSSGDSLFILHRSELRKMDSDGTVTLLADGFQLLEGMTLHQGKVYFATTNQETFLIEIWSSDGSPAGTRKLFTLPSSSHVQAGEPLFASDGQTLYLLFDQNFEEQIWRTDGTAEGSVLLARDVWIKNPPSAVGLGPLTFFGGLQGLWRTDGTPEGTWPVTTEGGGLQFGSPQGLIEHAGSLYLFDDYGPGWALWRTDGTAAGSTLLKTFAFPSHSDNPVLVALGGKLYFAMDDEVHGTELWVTDGTSAGTTMVSDIVPGPRGSKPSDFFVAGGVLYFSAHDAAHGRELWRSDGTAAGTRLVQDIAPEALSSSPWGMTVSGGRLFFTADDGVTGRELWSLPLAGSGGCQPSATVLCLGQGRFRVEAFWQDFAGNQGSGQAVPLTGDTGTFWFFDPTNTEVLVKVLDGRGLNDHFWVFYGALSSVAYSLTVTDTETGLSRRYVNPGGRLASVGDTEGFGSRGAALGSLPALQALPSPAALISARTEPAAATGSCQPGPRRLCLNDGRFAVEASWKDFQGNTGHGTAVPFTADTGWFWFFDPANVEVMLKVLDGTALNGKFWVFYGALSNVEYDLTVTDTHTGAVKQYRNPSGRFASVADTGAF